MSSDPSHLPITEVVVMEDRAQVVRRGLLQFSLGRRVIRIDGIADTVIEKTVAVSVLGPAYVRRVRVLRDGVLTGDEVGEEPPCAKKAELERLEWEREALEKARAIWAKEVMAGVEQGRAEREAWLAQLERLREQDKFLSERLRRAQAAEARSTREAAPRCALVVELECTEAGPHPVQVDYMVANATWRPCYEARLLRAAASNEEEVDLVFAMQACVWQRTGEDWNDAALVFTTQRTTSFVAPPHLRSDVLRSARKSNPALEPSHSGSVAHTNEIEEQYKGLPFPDDAGRALRFKSMGRMTVPNHGVGLRVFIREFRTRVKPTIIVQAERAVCARQFIALDNRLDWPLMPGPVERVGVGGWAGRSRIGWVDPEQSFELDWGRFSDLAVVRECRTEEASGRSGATRSTWKQRVDLKLSNLCRRNVQLLVEERIPKTSEGAFAKVDESETTGLIQRDEDGVIRWPLRLEPYDNASFKVSYRV